MSDFIASVALWFGVAFFLPLTILLGNSAELKSRPRQAAGSLAAISTLLTLLWFGLLLAVPSQLQAVASAMTLMLALLVLIQGQILIRHYGAFDGKEIDWTQFKTYTKVDALLWSAGLLTALGLAIFFKRGVLAYSGHAAIAILLLHSLNLLGHRSANVVRPHKLYYPNDRTMFDFSAERNVVVMVIDALRGDVARRLLEQNPDLRQKLQGFKFFDNTTGSYPTTNLSLPLVLTGVEYDNSQPYDAYLKKAFTSRTSLPYVLRKHGYLTDGHTACFQTIHCTPEVFSNFQPIDSIGALNLREVAHLIELALFRALPNFLKPFVYRNERWLFSSAFARVTIGASGQAPPYYMPWPKTEKYFLPKAEAEMTARSAQPTFKFYHLFGAHPPFWIGADGNEAEGAIAETQAAYETQALGCLQYLAGFVAQLKRAGVHDKTLMVVAGDHGAFAGDFPDGANVSVEQLMKIANPALFIKDFDSNTGLQVDSRPARLADIAGTVLHALDLGSDQQSLLANSKPLAGARHFYYFPQSTTWDQDTWAPPLHQYRIQGALHDPASWEETGLVLNPAMTDGEHYKLNSVATAEQLWSTPGLTVMGCYEPEFGLSWMTTSVTFYFSLPDKMQTPCALILDVEAVQPFCQGVTFSVGGAEEESTAVTGRQVLMLPGPAAGGGVMTARLELALPWPEARRDGFLLLDVARVLGLRFRRLALCDGAAASVLAATWQAEIAAAIEDQAPRTFAAGAGGIELLAGGWKAPEKNSVWSARRCVGLQLQVKAGQAVQLELQLVPFTLPGVLEFQRVIARADGRVLAELVVDKADIYRIDVPAELCGPGALRLTLELPDASSLASLGVGSDITLLGIRLYSVALKPIPVLIPERPQLFKIGADAEAWLVNGWKKPEIHSTWATGPVSRLRFGIRQSDQGILLGLRLVPLLSGDRLSRQRVNVRTQGELLTQWSVNANGWYRVAVPPALTGTGFIELELELPDACSLAALEMADNHTPLAVQLLEMSVVDLPEFPLDTVVLCKQDQPQLEHWLGQGWQRPGPHFVWSSRACASLHLMVGRTHESLVLRLRCTPLTVAGALDVQRVGVKVNGKFLTQLQVAHADTFNVFLSADVVGHGMLEVQLELPDASSLASLGLGEDTTPLAIQLSEVSLVAGESVPCDKVLAANCGSGIERWLGEGWKKPEEFFTWSAAHVAVLRLPIANGGRNVKLRLHLHPLAIPGRTPYQRVQAGTAALDLGQFELQGAEWMELTVPANAICYGVLELRLAMPDAMSLADLGLGTAAVRLGIQLHGLEVSLLRSA